mgnify:FL=1
MKIKKKYFKNNLDDLNKAYLSVPYIIDKNFERIDYFILTIYSYEHSQKIYELVLIDSGNDDSYIDEFNKTITPEQRLRD